MKKKTIVIYHMLVIVCILGLVGLKGCERTIEDVAKWKSQGKIGKLVCALGEEDREIRFAAAKALGELKAEPAVEPLAALLAESDPQLAITAIESLVAIGNESAEKHLVTAIYLEHSKVCLSAINGLGTLKSIRALQPLIITLNSPDNEIATAAATSLGLIGDEESIKPLAAKMQSHSSSLRLACVKSFRNIGGQEATAELANALGDINNKIRQFSIDSLVAIGEPAETYALAALRNKNAQARLGAVAVLKDSATVPTAGNDLVWYLLAQAPGENKAIDAATVSQLADMGNDAVEALLEAVAHDSSNLREHAFRALETIGEPCLLQAINAAEAHAGPAGKQWFNERTTWAGAPSWRIDLWGAATALNPYFKLNNHDATGLQSKESSLRTVATSKFQVSREYIPLLIDQIREAAKSENIELFKIDLFGADSQTIYEEGDWRISRKHLVTAGDLAVFPLIAALDASDQRVANVCANVLGTVGDQRAVLPLTEALSRQVDKGEHLTLSAFYIALQKFDDPAAEAILLKIRPDTHRAIRIFERQYPGCRITDTRSKNTQAGYSRPIAFQLDYHRDGKAGKLVIIFRKNDKGDWVPTPALPTELPR
ncbi:MAG: HEAT repeat domain-containing protein [Verrucomicrobia bacterium]|nr:HEAT repeat domain-containing protein [Verrucomicrobiota bacterium]